MSLTPLDIVVSLAALIVAVGLFVAWIRLEQPALLLFAAGLALKGIGYAFSAAPVSSPSGAATAADLLALGVLFAGNVLMVGAYLGAREGRGWRYVAWGIAGGLVALAILDLGVPPVGEIDLKLVSVVALSLISVANVACAVFSAHGFATTPTPSRALVPTAFLAWGLANYTSVLILLGSPAWLYGFVQSWRLLAVLLMLGALVLPRGGDAPAAT